MDFLPQLVCRVLIYAPLNAVRISKGPAQKVAILAGVALAYALLFISFAAFWGAADGPDNTRQQSETLALVTFRSPALPSSSQLCRRYGLDICATCRRDFV
ncbi:MAG: hypothetical protein IPK19_24940 [Chloroflexi bacterium]|nr:hypothetical protein [Chloroflexota bacterium]